MKFKKLDDISSFTILTLIFLYALTLIQEVTIPETIFPSFKIEKVNLLADITVDSTKLHFEHLDSVIIASKSLYEIDFQSSDSSEQTVIVQEELIDTVKKADPKKIVNQDTIKTSNKVDSTQLKVLSVDTLRQIAETPKIEPLDVKNILFEDYTEGKTALKIINEKLNNSKYNGEQIRFAFLGDSFIEGDIMTADIRNKLQSSYGGRGVGFVPIASVSAKFRTTIKHSFEGWKTFNNVKYKQADWTKFMLSGCYFTPTEEGAKVTYNCPQNSELLSSVPNAKLLFINEKHTKLTVKINSNEPKIFTPESSSKMQCIEFNDDIKSIELTVNDIDGFIGYGVVFNDNSGVSVDNFSVRGSSGAVLFSTNKTLCDQMKEFVRHDVIVLQYGLNVVSSETTNYNYYKKHMTEVVKQIKGYYPESIIIIMSISDRGMKSNNEVVTMPGIASMVNVQREIAQSTGIVFWDTFSAMGGKNSMQNFVQNSMANKDYTHINKAGGKRIAEAFVNSLLNIE